MLVTVKKGDEIVNTTDATFKVLKNVAVNADTTWNVGSGEYRVSMQAKNSGSGLYSSIKTTEVTVTKSMSQATVPPQAILSSFSTKTKEAFTIGWTVGRLVSSGSGMHKKKDGSALTSVDVRYKIYYASSTDRLTATQVKDTAVIADASSTIAGVVVVAASVIPPLSTSITDKAFVGTVYVVVESINDTDDSNTVLSMVTSYIVTGAAKAPGKAVGLSADISKALQITFRAIAPTDTGKKDNGVPVDKNNLKYWLYYAKVGHTPSGVGAAQVMASTNADGVIAAVSSTDANTDVGKVEITNIATGHTLKELTADDTYRYTVVVVHPSRNTYNSEASDAQTSEAVAKVHSQATIVDSVSTPTVTISTDTGFTVTWGSAVVTNAKNFDGASLHASDVSYVVYYVSKIAGTSAPNAASVKAAGATDSTTSGSKAVAANAPKTASVSDKSFSGTVYMILEAINDTDKNKTTLSTVMSYAVTGAGTEPGTPALKVPSPATGSGFTVTWDDAPITNKKKDDGASLRASDVSYVVYYVSKIASTPAPNAASVKAAGATDSTTSGSKAVAANAPKTASVRGKTFVGTVYMILEAINDTDKNKTTLSTVMSYAVSGEKVAPSKTTVPTVMVQKDRLMVQVTALAGNFGTSDDGSPLSGDDIQYIFYYAKKGETIDSKKAEEATADELIIVLKDLTESNKNKGKVILTKDAGGGIGTDKEVTNLLGLTDYYYTVRVQETSDATNGANTDRATKKTLTAIEKPGKLAGQAFSKTTTTGFTVIAKPPIDTGKKANGAPVDRNTLKYELYYARVGYTPADVSAAQVTTGTNAADIVQAVGVTNPNTQDVGKLTGIIGGAIRNIGFTVTGLSPSQAGTEYRYVIRTIHPDNGDLFTDTIGLVRTIAGIAVTAQHDRFTVSMTAITKAKTRKLVASDEKKITYFFYYAKKGERIGSKTAETATADELVIALKDLMSNDGNRGKVELTKTEGISPDKEVTSLTPNTEYYYTIRTQETDAPDNGSNAAIKSITTLSAAAAGTGAAPSITVTDGTAKGSVKITVTAIPGGTENTGQRYGLRHDGTTAVEAAEIKYWLYYTANGGTKGEIAKNLEDHGAVIADGTLSVTNGRVGIIDITTGFVVNKEYEVTGLNTSFPDGIKFFVLVIHPDGDADPAMNKSGKFTRDSAMQTHITESGRRR